MFTEENSDEAAPEQDQQDGLEGPDQLDSEGLVFVDKSVPDSALPQLR